MNAIHSSAENLVRTGSRPLLIPARTDGHPKHRQIELDSGLQVFYISVPAGIGEPDAKAKER
jgi:hypothetical protein